MTQVKLLYDGFIVTLEYEINKFLANNLNIDILDIKYSVTNNKDGDLCSAMIIYKDKS